MSKSQRDLIFGSYVTAVGAFVVVGMGGPVFIVGIAMMMVGFTITFIGWRRPD